MGSCTGALCSTGQAETPRAQHLGGRRWGAPEESFLAPPELGLPEATLTQELGSLDLGKWQGSVETSVGSPVNPDCRVKRTTPTSYTSSHLMPHPDQEQEEALSALRRQASCSELVSHWPQVSHLNLWSALTETSLLVNGADTMNLKAGAPASLRQTPVTETPALSRVA